MLIPYFPNYQLANPWWLLLLLLIPVLMLMRGRRGAAPALAFPMIGYMKHLGEVPRSRKGGLFFNLLYAALACGIIAMARPQKILSFEEVKSEGIAIVVACDVSLSMLIDDFYIGGRQVNRLEAAKRVLRDFIKGRPNDRIGIVAFAGAPYNPCPPTLDHDWLLENMDRIQTGLIEDGTAIGSGIAAAARRLQEQDVKSKVLVLLTDGASNSGKLSPKEAAKMAATLGIRIYAVSIGTPGRHLIRHPSGQIIDSGRQEFDPETLKEVAAIGSGSFFRAQSLNNLEEVFKTIDVLEKTDIQRKQVVETAEMFQMFISMGAVFCGLHLLWKQTVGRSSPTIA